MAAGAGGPGEASSSERLLSLEEAVCPVCLELLLRPVTMPCRHSLCLLCFQRTVELTSLCCPLCRVRVSNWARQRGREPGGLVDAELWERVQRSHPERCRRRLREEVGAAAEEPVQDFIFRAPIKLSKPGEVREEYERQLRKLKEESRQVKVDLKQLDGSLFQEEMKEGKRKIEAQLNEETLTVKLNQTSFRESLSDSENEEPLRGRTAHRSAFISKGSTDSSTAPAGNTKALRSRSCNDTLKDRSKSRQRVPRSNKVKISSVASASVTGILLSTENSRSFSAPELTLEKRPPGNFSSSALQKAERSISPESNDSISEELNHFKPIVCSPCTPPKKLPNGKVLKPIIIKSTPRNLTRNLQTPTSYETSPGVLKKWDTIFQERQAKKTLSQGTLTSFAAVCGEEVPNRDCVKKKRTIVDLSSNLLNSQSDSFAANTEIAHLSSVNDNTENGAGGKNVRSSEALIVRDHTFLLPKAVSQNPLEKSQSYLQAEINSNSDFYDLPISNLTFTKSSSVNRLVAETNGKILYKHGNNGQQTNLQNGMCGVRTDSKVEPPPSLRRGTKRRCKTKHLDQNGSLKRRKQVNDSETVVGDLFWGDRECKLWQENEDRKLAFRLQRVFNNEVQTVNRRKGSKDEYLLRSNSTTRAST